MTDWKFDQALFIRRFEEDPVLRHDESAEKLDAAWRRLTGDAALPAPRDHIARDDRGDGGYDLAPNGWVLEWSYDGGAIWERSRTKKET